MKLFYNSDGTVKVLPVSALPANAVWNGGFPYTPEGSLLVSIVSAKPTDTVSNGGFIQELWGGVCAGYDTPSIWIGGLAITSYGALCLDVDGGIVTDGPVLNLPLTHTAIPSRGTGSPTFTRATTATVMGYGPTDNAVDGLKLLTVAANEARFVGARRISEGVWSNTFADGSLIPAATNTGYLAEGARTNLCLQSNAFTTTWAAAGTPAATQNVIGPDGATSAWTLTDDNPAATEGVYQFITHTAATHTFSLFVKKVTSTPTSYPVLFVQNVGGSLLAITTIDNVSGVANVWTASTYVGFSVTTSSATCVSHNDDFWRVSLTYLATAEQWLPQIYMAGSTVPYALNTQIEVAAQGSAVFYGAQVELGSSASTYIPTTTAAVTRAADVLTYSSAGNVNYGAAHTVLCEATYNGIDNAGVQWNVALGSDVNYSGLLRLTTGAPNAASIYVSDSGGTQSSSVAGTEAARRGVMLKYAGTRNSTGGITHAANGTVGTTSAAAGAAGSVTAIHVGNHAGAFHLFGPIRNVRIWQRALSSSELQAITA